MSPKPVFGGLALALCLASPAVAAPSEGWFEPLPDEADAPRDPHAPSPKREPAQPTPPASPPPASSAPPSEPASSAPSQSSPPATAPSQPPSDTAPPAEAAPRQRSAEGTTVATEGATKEQEPERGFFLRAALGGGYFDADTGTSPDTRTFTGGTLSWHAMIGARVSRTLRLGGGYSRDHVLGLSVEDTLIDGDEPDPERFSLSLSVVGVFFDWQPSPRSGLYLELFVGPGVLLVNRDSNADIDEPGGIAWFLGIGYDLPVARHFSAGFLARMAIAPFQVSEVTPDRNVTSLVPALLVTASLR